MSSFPLETKHKLKRAFQSLSVQPFLGKKVDRAEVIQLELLDPKTQLIQCPQLQIKV